MFQASISRERYDDLRKTEKSEYEESCSEAVPVEFEDAGDDGIYEVHARQAKKD